MANQEKAEQKPMKEQIQRRIQAFGSFLSSMIMPNIGAFIAWGLITALFIPDGWLPNEELAKMVDPMIKFLIPLLIALVGVVLSMIYVVELLVRLQQWVSSLHSQIHLC